MQERTQTDHRVLRFWKNDRGLLPDLTDSDKEKHFPIPTIWADYEKLCGQPLGKLERFEFYERAKKAFVVIQSGEERQYGNLLLVKGCVL